MLRIIIGGAVALAIAVGLAVLIGLQIADDKPVSSSAQVSIPTQSQATSPAGSGIDLIVGTWKAEDDTSDVPTTVTIAADGTITNDDFASVGCTASVSREGSAYKVVFNCDTLGYTGSVTPAVSADGTTITIGKGVAEVKLIKVSSS